jgi:hypothetical protein
MWKQWVNLILALWVIVSPYIFEGPALATNLVIVGLVIGALALWSAVEHRSYDMTHSHA